MNRRHRAARDQSVDITQLPLVWERGKRLRAWDSGAVFTVNSYSNAYQWEGRPMYRTGSGWGH